MRPSEMATSAGRAGAPVPSRHCVFSTGRFLPCCFSISRSIGMPWQSQPGTYTASKPAMLRDLTMMSLRILLIAWPRWMSPFAYGGPAGRVDFGAPAMPRSCPFFRGQKLLGYVAIPGDARFQGIEVGKFFFIAYLVQEIDAQM